MRGFTKTLEIMSPIYLCIVGIRRLFLVLYPVIYLSMGEFGFKEGGKIIIEFLIIALVIILLIIIEAKKKND